MEDYEEIEISIKNTEPKADNENEQYYPIVPIGCSAIAIPCVFCSLITGIVIMFIYFV